MILSLLSEFCNFWLNHETVTFTFVFQYETWNIKTLRTLLVHIYGIYRICCYGSDIVKRAFFQDSENEMLNSESVNIYKIVKILSNIMLLYFINCVINLIETSNHVCLTLHENYRTYNRKWWKNSLVHSVNIISRM